MVHLLTPESAAERSVPVRFVLAGFTLATLLSLGTVALAALCLLTLALAVIYFIATEILGVRIELDPATFVERAREYAQRQS